MKKPAVHPDVEMLQIVAKALGPLRDEVVFVGGATPTLYVDDPAAPASVATLDVDCVVELSSLLSFAGLEKKLRKLGFKQPVAEPNPPICRWALGEIIVDIMPSDPKILGFSNRWYKGGIANRETRKLPDGSAIFIFSLPFFVGSKLEAVKSRGGNDLRFSHDLEDIAPFLQREWRQIKRPKFVWTAGSSPTGRPGEFEIKCGMGVHWMNRRMGP